MSRRLILWLGGPAVLVAVVLIAVAMRDDAADMTHHAFVPICMKSGQGLSAPRMELACLCLWNDGIGRVTDAKLRARILSSYRRHGGLALRLDQVPEAQRPEAEKAMQMLTATLMQCAAKAAAARE